MQPVDLTTLVASCYELSQCCLPARLERVYQHDRHTLYLALRSVTGRSWLLLSWHPQAARLHLSDPPPPQTDTFAFSQQIWHQVSNLALTEVSLIDPWERVVDLRFARRPDDPVLWHLYLEVMGKYSNAVLVNEQGTIVTAAHQVNARQSSVRPIQTGDVYRLPPPLLETVPDPSEAFDRWRDRLALVPQEIQRSLVGNYRGISTALARSLLEAANIPPRKMTSELFPSEWQALHHAWLGWLQALSTKQFSPSLREKGYTAIGQISHTGPIGAVAPPHVLENSSFPPVNQLLFTYYSGELQRDRFQQIHQQVAQVLQSQLTRQQAKLAEFAARLVQSDRADTVKDQADLLMAHLHSWQPGMKSITLPDFTTGDPVAIALDPTVSAVQNAQAFYKRHQKLRRSRAAILPLMADVEMEIVYLEQVAAAFAELMPDDLPVLQEIHLELIQQGYLKRKDVAAERGREKEREKGKGHKKKDDSLSCHRYQSPSGFEIWVGRNNYQNDLMTFRFSNSGDLWFHAQEIPGSHVLLRLTPGNAPDNEDLQAAADLAAYHSRARHSDRVPVVFTHPDRVFKPRGAKPGMVVYKQEKVIWGQPDAVKKS